MGTKAKRVVQQVQQLEPNRVKVTVGTITVFGKDLKDAERLLTVRPYAYKK